MNGSYRLQDEHNVRACARKKGMLMYVRDLRLGKFPRIKGEGLVGDVYGAHARAPECSCKSQG